MLSFANGLHHVDVDPFELACCALEVGQQQDASRRGPEHPITHLLDAAMKKCIVTIGNQSLKEVGIGHPVHR